MVILVVLNLSIHENEIHFNLFVSFISCYGFQYTSLIPIWLKFTPKYFILFDKIINRILSLFFLLFTVSL